MRIPDELLERTRVKAYTTMIAICDDPTCAPEIRLQAALALLQLTEREPWIDMPADTTAEDAEPDSIDAQPAGVGGGQVSDDDSQGQLAGTAVSD